MSTEAPLTYDLSLLGQSAATWARSPALRAIYQRLYARARSLAPAGPILEVGSGISTVKEFWPEVVTSDVAATPYVERVASAYALEQTGHWAAILAVDVLHHLTEPFTFFRSASRSLQAGGRLILVEPAATPWGRLLYRAFHHEPCDPASLRPPFRLQSDPDGGFANMGMGQALFRSHREWTGAQLRAMGMEVKALHYHDLVAYFLTGGFSRRLPTPTVLVRWIASAEDLLPQALHRLCGTRMTLALEKTLS